MHNLLKPAFFFFSSFSLLLFFGLMLSSCGNETPMYMNSEDDLMRIQNKIESLADGAQIDSVSLRSTVRKSEISSILIIATNEKDTGKMKSLIEFIPKQKLKLKEKSYIKKDALHSYKINLTSITQYIDQAKNMLPTNYSYVDVNNIMYAASPFGEKYYLVLEVAPTDKYVADDFVEVFYTQSNPMGSMPTTQSSVASDACYVIKFLLQNGHLEMIKK